MREPSTWGVHLLLTLALALGCGSTAEDVGSRSDDETRVKDASSMSPTTDVTSPGQSSDTIQFPDTVQSPDTAVISAECVLPPGEFVDVVTGTFVNHTNSALYLASSNEDCGSLPAYIEFRRDGETVDIYDGDCVSDCSAITSSGYRSHGDLPADCGPSQACNAPVRMIHPGTQSSHSVLPVYGTLHDVPGSCFFDRAATTCLAQHALPAGKYTLVARAYTELKCGDEPCECYQDVGGYCLETGDVFPRGAGDVRTVEVEFDFDPQQSGRLAPFEFY